MQDMAEFASHVYICYYNPNMADIYGNLGYISFSITSLASPSSWYISFSSIDHQGGMHILQADHTPTRQPCAAT